MLLVGLFALALMLVPTPASATGVEVAAAILTYVTGTTVAATSAAAIALSVAMTIAVSVTLSYVASALLKPSGRSGGGAGMPDTSLSSKASVRQPTAPMQVVYGQTKVGGVFADMWVSDATNQLLCGALIIAGHEITGIDELWLGDENTILDANGYITGGRYAGNGTFLQYFGTNDQTACQMLIDNSNGRWTTDHRLRGLAYLAFQLYWDNTTGNGNPAAGNFVVEHRGAKLWQGSLPNMTAVIRGRKIYDPRTGQTAYSNNSALVVADYLCDKTFGLGVDYATGIDEAALIAAANACDELVTLDAGGTEKRYTTDGFFKVDGSPDAILGRLLGAMHGQAIYDGERWVIKAGIWEEPDAVVLTDDDMRAASSLQTLTSTRDISNGVKGTYVGAETKWQPADFPSLKSTTFTTDDGGVDKWRDIELPYSSTSTRCQRLAKIDLLKQRYEIVETFKGKLSCWRYTAGQTVYRTSERYGWTNKAFMIGSVRVVPDQDAEGNPMVGVDLTLYETAASIYNWSTSEETPIRTPTTPPMGDPYSVLPPSNFSATEEVYTTAGGLGVKSKIVLTWTASSDALVNLGGHYEVEWRKVGDTAWNRLANTTDTLQEILDVQAASYQFRLRAVNYAGNPSTYVTASLTVTGDATAPEDVVGFTAASGISGYTTFTWTAPVYERARAGTAEMRYSTATSGATWATATAIVVQSALNTQATIQTKIGTYLIKYKSANGVYSVNAASAVISTTQQPQVGIEIVSTLPTTDLFDGRMVYLTTDGKLYRYVTGTGWTRATAAGDLTGQITNSQIADMAAAKLTGSITTTQISDNAISTPKLAAGAVVASKIASQAITTEKLFIGDFNNYVSNSNMALGAVNWGTGNSSSYLTYVDGLPTSVTMTAGTGYEGSGYHIAVASAAPAFIVQNANRFAVTPGDMYLLRATVQRVSSPNQTLYVALRFVNAVGTEVAVTTGTQALSWTSASSTSYETKTIASDSIVVPTGAVWGFAVIYTTGTLSGGSYRVGEVTVLKKAGGSLIVDGSIVADKLATNSVTADKVFAGAITAAKMDVTQLSAISADLGTVLAGTITGATHQTASSGSVRAVMDTRIMFRCEDPNYASRTYYRSVGWSEPNITSHIGAEGGYSYSRLLNYNGTTALDVQTFGSLTSPTSASGLGIYSRGTGTGIFGFSEGHTGVKAAGDVWDFYADGNGSNYGPFTGSHDALLLKTHDADQGDIVVDVELIARKSVSNALTRVERSSAANQQGALGVVSRRSALTADGSPAAISDGPTIHRSYSVISEDFAGLVDTHDRLQVNAVGEGLINVCGQGGDIAIGDLIVTSDVPGKGMRQADDIIRGYTVAKARETATFATAGEVKTIACIYVSG